MRTWFIALLLQLFLIEAAHAQNCDSILDSRLLNRSQVVDRGAARSALAASFCNRSYREVQASGGFNAEASYGLFGASGGTSESQFQSWKTENCGSSSSDQSSNRYRYEAQRALNSEAIAAWQACMIGREGLTCFVSPPRSGGGAPVATLNWRPLGRGRATVQRASILNGTNAAEPELGSQLYTRGSELLGGTDTVLLGVTDPRRPVQASLSIEYNGARHSCEIYIPPRLNPIGDIDTRIRRLEQLLATSASQRPSLEGMIQTQTGQIQQQRAALARGEGTPRERADAEQAIRNAEAGIGRARQVLSENRRAAAATREALADARNERARLVAELATPN